MASGLILVLSVTVMAPDWRPVVVGVNVTFTAQCFPIARLPPQSLVWLKLPFPTMLAMLRLKLLGLLIVTVRRALVVPTPWEPKLSAPGETALKAILNTTESVEVVLAYPAAAARSGAPS